MRKPAMAICGSALALAALVVPARAQDHAQDKRDPIVKEDDPGRPVLRRGGAATKRTDSTPAGSPATVPDSIRDTPTGVGATANDASAKPGVTQPDNDDPVPEREHANAVIHAMPGDDEVIGKARTVVGEFTYGLPNFICDELVKRYESKTVVASWKYLDRIETELAFESSREQYSNIRRNGKRLVSKDPQDTGQWSHGDFNSALLEVLNPASRATFRKRPDESTASEKKTVVYDFRVARANSNWTLRVNFETKPEHTGSLWIEPDTGRVLRLEMMARSIPAGLGIDKMEMTVDYDLVRIGDKRYLLPVKSANLSCFTGTFECHKNEIEFRNFRKFQTSSEVLSVDSELTFPDEDEDQKTAKPRYEPPQISTPKKNP